ncbi:hypothetical protein ACFXJ8_14375 [Nonomuraea sp. NPDC059194]
MSVVTTPRAVAGSGLSVDQWARVEAAPQAGVRNWVGARQHRVR